jgi:hypothetical protein
MFTITPCKTKGMFYARPDKRMRLDMGKLSEFFEIILQTPIMTVIKAECGEAVVHAFGRIDFKECKDQEKMRKTAKKIYERCGNC